MSVLKSKNARWIGVALLAVIVLVAILALPLQMMPTSSAGKPPTATPQGTAVPPQQITVYGVWHCGDDYCTWSTVRDMNDFDTQNHWLIDRGDGSGKPSVNLVILSFVHPLKLMNKTTDAGTVNGIPIGMNAAVVNYFKSRGVRVMLSIGGITYTDAWHEALDTNPTQFGLNAAEAANNLGVGIEIDYEGSNDARLEGLGQFIAAYRSVIPYDASGNNPAARLTIDLGAGNRFLTVLSREATLKWLVPSNPVLDYANAMVPGTGDPTTAQWQEHITGMPQYAPPVPPKAPAKLVGGLWLTSGRNPIANCINYASSTQKAHSGYVQTVPPDGQGTTRGMLGYSFWAAECPSTRNACTTPPNTCELGLGAGMRELNVAFPMPALRQQ